MSSSEEAAEPRKPSKKEKLINNEWVVGYSNTYHKKYYFNIYTNNAVWNVHEMQSINTVKNLKKHRIREPDCPPTDQVAVSTSPQRPDDKRAPSTKPTQAHRQPTCNSPTALLTPFAPFATGNLQNNQPNNIEQPNPFLNPNIWMRPNPVQFANQTQGLNTWTNLSNVPQMNFGMPTNLNNGLQNFGTIPTNFSNFPAPNFGNPGSFVNMNPNFVFPSAGNFPNFVNPGSTFHSTPSGSNVNLSNFGVNFSNFNSNNKSDSSEFVSPNAHNLNASQFNTPNSDVSKNSTSSGNSQSYFNSPDNAVTWIKATNVPMSQRFLKEHKITDHRVISKGNGQTLPILSFTQSPSENEESEYDVERDKEFHSQNVDDLYLTEEEDGGREKLKECDLRLKLIAKRRASCNNDQLIDRVPEVRKRRNSVSGDLLEKAVNMHISEDKLQDEDETDDETDTIAKSELNAIKNKGSSLGRELLKRAEPGVSRDICYVICDTNIFIDGLLFVKQLVFSDDDNLIRIVVPWRIHNELEGILKGRNIQILSKKKARDINRFLHDESMKEHSVYIGQKPPSIIQCLNPDDEILDCCMQYVKKKNHVVLITNDKPLLTKARYANIQVYNLEQMQKMLDLVKEPQVDSLMKMKISINNSLAFVKPQRNTDNVTSRTQNVESSDNQMYQGLQSQSNQKPSNVKLPVNIWQRLSNTESNQNVPSNSWQIPANSGIPNISLWQNTTNAGIHNISSWQMPSNPGIPAQPIWQNMHSSANMQMPMNVPLMSNSQNFPSAPWQIPTTYNPAFSQPSSFANATFNHSIVNTNISTEQESSTTNSPRVSTKSNNTQSSSTIVSSRNASTWCLGNPSERDSEGKDENMPTGLTNETAKKQENTAATDVNNTDDYIHNNNTGTRKIQLKRKPMEASYYYAPKKPRRLWRNRPCKPSVPVWSFQCTSTTQNPNVPPQPTSVPPQPTYVPPQSTSVPPQPTSAQNIGFNTDNSQGVQNASYAKDQSIPTSNAQIGISNAPNLENEPNCKKDTALNNTNTLSINKTQSQITITDNRLLSVSKDLATSYDWTKYKINRRPELQAPKRMYTIDMRANSDKDMDNEESAKNAGATSLDIDSRTMRTRLWKRTDEWACVFVQAMENLLSDILWQSKSPNYLLPPPWNLHEAAVCIQKLHEKDKQIASTAGGFAAVVEQATTRNNPDVDVVAKVSQKKKIIFSTVMPSSPKLFMEMYKQGVGLITALKEKYPESEDILMTEHVLSELLLDIRYAGRDKRFTEINQFVEIADEHPVSQDNADTNITDECPSPETRDNYGDIIQYLKKHFAEWESYKEGTESLTRPNLKKRKKNTETKDSKTDKLEIHNKNETHLLDNKSKTNKDIITANTIFNDDAYYAVKANEMYDKDENAVTENIVNAEGTKKEPKIVRNLNCVLPEFEELLKQKKAISGNLDDDFDYEDDYEGDENYYCDEHFHYEDGEYDEYDYDENIDNNEEQDTVKDGPLVNGDKISANNEPNLAVNGDYEPDDVNQINNEENNVNEEDENVNEKDMEVCEENNNVVNQFDLARVTSTIIKAHKNVRAYLVMQVRKQMQVDVPNSDGDPSLLPADTELKEALKGFNRCMRDVISGKPEVAAGLTAYLLRLVPDGGPLPDPDVIYRIFSQQKDILQNAVRHFEMLLKILDALPVHSNNGIPREATNTLYSFVAEQSLDTYMV